jgi:ABC-type uncharacterized transport system substrate-binding protein
MLLECKSAEGNPERLNDLGAELVREQVDVIVTAGTPAVFAAKKATSTIRQNPGVPFGVMYESLARRVWR